MAVVDIIILTIVLLSVAVSIIRGFVKEAMSLLVWIFAIWLAISFSGQVDEKLAGSVTSPSVRIVVAFLILFIPTIFLGAIMNSFISGAIKNSHLSSTDRMLGVVFGASRGVLIIVVMVMFIGNGTVTKKPWWKESVLIVHFQGAADWVKGKLPGQFSAKKAFSLSMRSPR